MFNKWIFTYRSIILIKFHIGWSKSNGCNCSIHNPDHYRACAWWCIIWECERCDYVRGSNVECHCKLFISYTINFPTRAASHVYSISLLPFVSIWSNMLWWTLSIPSVVMSNQLPMMTWPSIEPGRRSRASCNPTACCKCRCIHEEHCRFVMLRVGIWWRFVCVYQSWIRIASVYELSVLDVRMLSQMVKVRWQQMCSPPSSSIVIDSNAPSPVFS